MPRLFIAKHGWTAEEDALLKSLTSSGKHGYKDMVAFFPGRTRASLVCRANQKLKIVNAYEYRRWEYNEHYFHTPDIVNSYIAGFLAADGCINIRTGDYGYRLILELGNEDLQHLEWMKDTVGYKGPTFKNRSGRSSGFSTTISEQCKDDLGINFGVIPRKSRRLRPPTHLSWEHRFSYLLGLLDGDGCVHINKENALSINLVSCAKECLDWMKEFVDCMDLPMLRRVGQRNVVGSVKGVDAYSLHYTGARAVCFVQLAQAFAAKHNLPILARKWNNPRLNQYITDFHAQRPAFRFDAQTKLAQMSGPTQLANATTSS